MVHRHGDVERRAVRILGDEIIGVHGNAIKVSDGAPGGSDIVDQSAEIVRT